MKIITTKTEEPAEVTQVEEVEEVKTEHPQKVYNTKKRLFRYSQVIWYVTGFIEALLLFRFLFKALNAYAFAPFVNLIYALTQPLILPFNRIFANAVGGNSVIELSTILAGIVYLCFAWGLIYFLDLMYPITPRDVSVA